MLRIRKQQDQNHWNASFKQRGERGKGKGERGKGSCGSNISLIHARICNFWHLGQKSGTQRRRESLWSFRFISTRLVKVTTLFLHVQRPPSIRGQHRAGLLLDLEPCSNGTVITALIVRALVPLHLAPDHTQPVGTPSYRLVHQDVVNTRSVVGQSSPCLLIPASILVLVQCMEEPESINEMLIFQKRPHPGTRW